MPPPHCSEQSLQWPTANLNVVAGGVSVGVGVVDVEGESVMGGVVDVVGESVDVTDGVTERGADGVVDVDGDLDVDSDLDVDDVFEANGVADSDGDMVLVVEVVDEGVSSVIGVIAAVAEAEGVESAQPAGNRKQGHFSYTQATGTRQSLTWGYIQLTQVAQ